MPGIINPDLLEASILYARFASAAYSDQTAKSRPPSFPRN